MTAPAAPQPSPASSSRWFEHTSPPATPPHDDMLSAPTGPTIPTWVKDAVFYQIFPERFHNGDVANDPVGTQPWGTTPTVEGFQGGDLQGVTQRLGYLAALGVNALYLNPVFTAPSNHKYNTVDYEHVDPAFGGDTAFRTFVDAAHRNGVKVMLDGVFNHVSHQHPWFEDVRERGSHSPYADRFTIYNWPIQYRRDADGVLRSDDYRSWWNFATLPELRTDNPAVRDYFLTGENAIVKRWIRDGHIDGWRMDVADDSNFTPDYWRTARQAIKAANPEAYMVAEHWKDASAMLQGDQFDGSMNYQYFTFPVSEYFAKKSITSDEFVRRLRNDYPSEARFGAFNILDSHDTPRFITQGGGDWYRLRPAAIFQMTYQGAPVVYYGDEIGMEGGKDPDSRRAMEWQYVPNGNDRHSPFDDADATVMKPKPGLEAARRDRAQQLFELYRTLIATRRREPALRRGEFQVLGTHNDDSTLSYRRWVPGDARDAIVALNNNVVSKDVHVPMAAVAPDGTSYTDALTGATLRVANGELVVPNLDGNYGAVLLRHV